MWGFLIALGPFGDGMRCAPFYSVALLTVVLDADVGCLLQTAEDQKAARKAKRQARKAKAEARAAKGKSKGAAESEHGHAEHDHDHDHDHHHDHDHDHSDAATEEADESEQIVPASVTIATGTDVGAGGVIKRDLKASVEEGSDSE